MYLASIQSEEHPITERPSKQVLDKYSQVGFSFLVVIAMSFVRKPCLTWATIPSSQSIKWSLLVDSLEANTLSDPSLLIRENPPSALATTGVVKSSAADSLTKFHGVADIYNGHIFLISLLLHFIWVCLSNCHFQLDKELSALIYWSAAKTHPKIQNFVDS